MMSSNQQFLQNLYAAFNKGEIETIISVMHPDVKWANGVEGGFVYGRDAVREYWTNQYKVIQVQLETLKFETDENNRNVVTSLYEIGETETIQEMIQKTRTPNE